MKRLLLASLAGLAFGYGGTASAADLGVRPAYKAPPSVFAPSVAWTWTGVYFGANVGSIWGSSKWDSNFEGGLTAEPEPIGVTAGGQVGFNWQFNNIVIGVEADLNTSGARDIAHALGPSTDETFESTLRGFGTVRGRLGLAFDLYGPSMIYGTAGWAYGRFHHFGLDDGDEVILDVKSNESGWAWGAGFEHAMFENWTVRSEFLYLDFGDKTFAGGPDAEAIGSTFRIEDTAWVWRFGLNRKLSM